MRVPGGHNAEGRRRAVERMKIESTKAPAAIGPYSQAVKVSGQVLLFVSGQLGLDPATGAFAGDTVEAQTERALKNVLAIVEAAGGTKASLVKTTVYLRDLADFARMNEVYARLVGEPFPARACLGGLQIPKNGLVEIEAVAVI
jgi:2-iminobutanoate/2-iminopropanoate deaminase